MGFNLAFKGLIRDTPWRLIRSSV